MIKDKLRIALFVIIQMVLFTAAGTGVGLFGGFIIASLTAGVGG
jgi:hypothetical protein